MRPPTSASSTSRTRRASPSTARPAASTSTSSSRRRDRRGDRRGRVVRRARRHARRRLAHRRAERQERHRLDHPRRRARADLRRVRGPHRRVRDRHRAAVATRATRSSSCARASRRCCRRASSPTTSATTTTSASRPTSSTCARPPTSRRSSCRARIPGLIRRLFELEVPEIYDGIVEIKSVAREPGMRSKVAVSSREPGLDPVGACVGPKGSRVRMIVGELRGERIDVVPWNEDPADLRGQRAVAGQGRPRAHRRGQPHRDRHRARRPALARHRQGGPERPPRRQAHRLAHRHQERVAWPPTQGIAAAADRRHEAATEEFDGRCGAVTSTGVRCRNQARPGSFYCGLHEKEAAAE